MGGVVLWGRIDRLVSLILKNKMGLEGLSTFNLNESF